MERRYAGILTGKYSQRGKLSAAKRLPFSIRRLSPPPTLMPIAVLTLKRRPNEEDDIITKRRNETIYIHKRRMGTDPTHDWPMPPAHLICDVEFEALTREKNEQDRLESL